MKQSTNDCGVLKVANAQGFWGDQPGAAKHLAEQCKDLDFITMDYLAELSLSIMAIQKEKDATLGYAKDFVDVIESLVSGWNKGRKVKVVSNAGGLNPSACAAACRKILEANGLSNIKVAVVKGDDILKEVHQGVELVNLETAQPSRKCYQTANVYMGAEGIIKALEHGADIVVTGRVADPSLTVGPCAYHFNWQLDDWNRIAAASVAGHLIECGTQLTGGCSTDWLELDGDPGFPIVEMSSDGSFVVTKLPEDGGIVSERTVKEQLLYEVGDPDKFLTPDVDVSLLSVKVAELTNDRVKVSGVVGRPKPKQLKVNATWKSGYKAEGMLTVVGRGAEAKARRSGELLLKRLKLNGFEAKDSLIEVIGSGDVGGTISVPQDELLECVLRIAVFDHYPEPCLAFSKELASLVTCGPQGVTGYSAGRPKVRPVFGFWPSLVNRSLCQVEVEVIG